MQIRVEGWLGRRERRRKKKKRCHRAPAVKIQTPVIYIVSGTKPGNEWRRVRTASAKTRVIDRRGGGSKSALDDRSKWNERFSR